MLIRAELKHFSINMRFSANYVQSDDFCFFSSRKRRNKIRLCLFFIFPIRGWPVPDSIRQLAPTGDLERSIAKTKKAPFLHPGRKGLARPLTFYFFRLRP